MTAAPQPGASELDRLRSVMHAIRQGCPWDAEQTHASLATYLVEESAEVLEALETDDAHLAEELGDLLLQIYFHAEIAAEEGRFTLDDVARGIADKLIARHPYVFTDAPVPDDVLGSWEQRKAAEKGRTSALDGIPVTLDTLARAGKIVARTRNHGVPLDLPAEPITAEQAGRQIVDLVARAQASGVDADQAVRAAVRELEAAVRTAEASEHRPRHLADPA